MDRRSARPRTWTMTMTSTDYLDVPLQLEGDGPEVVIRYGSTTSPSAMRAWHQIATGEESVWTNAAVAVLVEACIGIYVRNEDDDELVSILGEGQEAPDFSSPDLQEIFEVERSSKMLVTALFPTDDDIEDHAKQLARWVVELIEDRR